MVIYLDIVLLENFIINTFLLLFTFKLSKTNTSYKRLLIASFIGTIYTITMIFPILKFFSLIPFQIIIAYIMVSIASTVKDYKIIAKNTVVFICSSLFLAGLCFKFSSISASYHIFNKVELSISIKELVLSLSICFMLGDMMYRYFKERAIVKSLIYDVEITINCKKYQIKGFLDTGNSLVEPITKLPCILVNSICLGNLSSKNYFVIPYKCVGFSGILKGYKSEGIRIRTEKGSWKNISALICPCSQNFSLSKDYNALLSRDIL